MDRISTSSPTFVGSASADECIFVPVAIPSAKADPTARRHRHGFTLIELMVAIGIILILVAVSVAGIAHVARHAKAQRTQTALETARSLLAGYVASDSSQSALKKLYDKATPCQLDSGLATDLDQTYSTVIAAKGPNGEKHWPTIDSTNQNLARSLDYTAQVMQLLLRVPENKAIMDKLPSEAKYVLTDNNNVPLANVPPFLADGNGEPILFIPPSGLSNVSVSGGVTNGILQSDGRVHPTSGTDIAPNPLKTPFFASAGSDRDFTTGDDNAYTFHQ